MCNLRPVAKLHNLIMAKVGLEPIYEIVIKDSRLNKEKYMMRVTCQLSLNDEPVSALGYCGGTKEIAKEKAAVAFMEKFSLDYNDTEVGKLTFSTTGPVCRMLERHCLQNNLGAPQYYRIFRKENFDGKFCIVQCAVSEFTAEGRGLRLDNAVLTAATRMIEILTETGANDENSTPERNSIDEHNITSTPAETPKIRRNLQLHKFMNDNKKYKRVGED